MAVIFYYTSNGSIYGVHADLASAPPRPDGVSYITVAETPENINWPIPANENNGKEGWCKVNLVTLALTVDESKVPDPFDKTEKMIRALAIWTRLKLNALRNDPLTT